MDDLNEIRDLVSNAESMRNEQKRQVNSKIRSHRLSSIKSVTTEVIAQGGNSFVICFSMGEGRVEPDQASQTKIKCDAISSSLIDRIGARSEEYTVDVTWESFASILRRILSELEWTYAFHYALAKGEADRCTYLSSFTDNEGWDDFDEDFALPQEFKEPHGPFHLYHFDGRGELVRKGWAANLSQRSSLGGYLGPDWEGDYSVNFTTFSGSSPTLEHVDGVPDNTACIIAIVQFGH